MNEEMTAIHNEILDLEMKNTLHRANSASERERARERERERKRARARERERERARDRETLDEKTFDLVNQNAIDENNLNRTKIV